MESIMDLIKSQSPASTLDKFYHYFVAVVEKSEKCSMQHAGTDYISRTSMMFQRKDYSGNKTFRKPIRQVDVWQSGFHTSSLPLAAGSRDFVNLPCQLTCNSQSSINIAAS